MPQAITKEERDHLWDHFKFNADQRIKAFNFFVILSVFVNGGLFNAYDKNFSPIIMFGIGTFVILLAIVFYLIDTRSGQLTKLSIPGLMAYETIIHGASSEYGIFNLDRSQRHSVVRYTFAFRVLYLAQGLVGLAVIYISSTHIATQTTPINPVVETRLSCVPLDKSGFAVFICNQR